jgi:hypothetical protein
MLEVRLTTPEHIEEVRATLENLHVVLVEFCAQATRYPLLIVPDVVVDHIGGSGNGYGGSFGDYCYVGLMEFGQKGPYPLMLGCLSSGYVHEKLGLKTEACARNVTVFLNCLGSSKGVQGYLATIPLVRDHVDHDHTEVWRV